MDDILRIWGMTLVTVFIFAVIVFLLRLP